MPSAAKNIVSFGRLELSFVVVSPEGSRTSVAGNGGTRLFSFSHASRVAKSRSVRDEDELDAAVALQRLLLEEDAGELVRGAGRARREEMQDERVARPPDEVAGLPVPRLDDEAPSRVEVQDPVVVVGMRRGREREPVGLRHGRGDDDAGGEEDVAAAGRCHRSLPESRFGADVRSPSRR